MMKLKEHISVVKDVVFMLIVVFLAFKIVPMFSNSQVANSQTTIKHITESVVKATLAANDAKLHELEKRLETKNSASLIAIKKTNEKIKEIGIAVAQIKGTASSEKSDIISGGEDHSKDIDTTVVYQTVAGGKELPVATVYYSPNVKHGDKWGVQTHPIKYYASVISTQSRDGSDNRYVEMWAENNFTTQSKGKKYPLTISHVDWVKKELSNKEFMYNKRLSFSSNLGMYELYPSIDLSFFSYGKTNRDMDWKFIEFSFGGTHKNLYIGFIPVSYNVGHFIPLVENLFVGPYINTDMESLGTMFNYGINFSIPF